MLARRVLKYNIVFQLYKKETVRTQPPGHFPHPSRSCGRSPAPTHVSFRRHVQTSWFTQIGFSVELWVTDDLKGCLPKCGKSSAWPKDSDILDRVAYSKAKARTYGRLKCLQLRYNEVVIRGPDGALPIQTRSMKIPEIFSRTLVLHGADCPLP